MLATLHGRLFLFSPRFSAAQAAKREQLAFARLKTRLQRNEEIQHSMDRAGGRATERKIPSYLKELVDIDGDGNVDPEEASLMRQLQKVVGTCMFIVCNVSYSND
jgi:hypothetical protein